MLTSPPIRALRNFSRKLGLNQVLGKVISGRQYEDKFGTEIQSHIHNGSIIWDIGANVGLYTESFLEKTGSSGKVIAFEPIPSCFSQLVSRFSNVQNIILKNMAIGEKDGTLEMQIEDNPLAPTHRVVLDPVGLEAENITQVEVRSVESIVYQEPENFPNVIKIDVEGHEGSVLHGMTSILNDNRLHCIGIEVHFGLLEERGEGDTPRQIEQLLKKNNFNVDWTDPSHIVATR